MNIGAGLAALDEYYKEGDRRQVRDYQQKVRESELSLLPDKTAATRSGYQDTTAVNAARAQLRPGQTANAQAKLGLEAADLEGQAARQPTEIATKGIQSDLALAGAQNDQTNLPMTLQVKNDTLQGQALTSAAQLKQLPAKLAQAATQGVIDQQGQADVVLGTMGQLIGRQDKAGALAFANEIAKNGNLLPGTNGKTFTDIIPVRKGENGAQGDGYIFVTAEGDQKFAPVEAIGGAMQRLKSGKYKFLHTADGAVYSGNENTGALTQVHAGNPDHYKRTGMQHAPADVQSTEWLMANVPKFKGNPEAAWDAVRSSKEKTRTSFIMDYVSKNALPGQDTTKLSQDAGQIYDSLRQTMGGGQQKPAPVALGSGTYNYNEWAQ